MSPKQYRANNMHLSISPIGLFAKNCNFMLG